MQLKEALQQNPLSCESHIKNIFRTHFNPNEGGKETIGKFYYSGM